MSNDKLTEFTLNDETLTVDYVETMTVKNGVECDIYTFADDDSRDLAIVTVKSGCKTPLQRILSGEKTIEGFYSGAGTLTVADGNGNEKRYAFSADNTGNVEVVVSQIMQWYANTESDLVFYEICQPPYKDGRFENIADLD